MKGSLLVLSMFFVGCVLGYVWNFSGWELEIRTTCPYIFCML